MFTKLPPEVRDKIWEVVLPAPRVVMIDWQMKGINRASSSEHLCICNANPIPTALLHICARSPKFALDRYELAFVGPLERPIYFDWERDSVYLSNILAISAFSRGINDVQCWGKVAHPQEWPQSLTKLQHLAFHLLPSEFEAVTEDILLIADFAKQLATMTYVRYS